MIVSRRRCQCYGGAMNTIVLRSLLVSAMFTIGCYSDDPAPQYAGGDDGNGDLVEVSPGVEVLADYDEPIFFADDFYWVNRGGIWYSSTWYGGGWGRAGNVPAHISGIAHPEGYAHYRPAGWVAHEQVHGGYAAHAQYHAAHATSGGVHVRAAVHGGGGGHHR
jgi:hypothetical protein